MKIFSQNNNTIIVPATSAKMAQKRDNLWQQIMRYICFGAISTAIDFVVLNLCLYAFHIPSMVANTIALAISLIVSYPINERLIFRGKHKHTRQRQIIYFVVVTLVGQFGLQSGLFALLTANPLAQNAVASFLAPMFGHIPYAVIASNVVKMLATIATGVWSFVFSRQFVFASHPTTD